MATYVVLDIDVLDPAGYEEYRRHTASLEQYGAEFIVRGGAVERLEGDWEPKRLVVLRFDSREQALRWWNSPEYRDAKQIRQRTARTNAILVDGV